MKAAYKGQVSLTHLLLGDRLTACATRFSGTELYFSHKVYFLELRAPDPQHGVAVLFPSVGVPPYVALHLSKPTQDSRTTERADVQLPCCVRNSV